MAKAQRKQQEVPQEAIQAAVNEALAKQASAPATVKEAPKESNVIPHPAVLVFDGNLNGTNIADVKQVHPADIEAAGGSLKMLAYNVMVDRVDPALMDRDAKFWANRTLKDTKTAFFGLMGVKGKDGKSPGTIIREAWNKECESKRGNPRARIAQVTLSGLWKLFKAPRSGGGDSPYGRMKGKCIALANDILAIMKSKAGPKHKFEMIEEKCSKTIAELEE